MKTIKNFMGLAKIFAFALSVVIFCFPTVAMAETSHFECSPYYEYGLDIDEFRVYVPSTMIVNSAVVSELGVGKSIQVDDILIAFLDHPGAPSYTCKEAPFRVKDGDDLIEMCGPYLSGFEGAVLFEGDTELSIHLSDPIPQEDGYLCVDLYYDKL